MAISTFTDYAQGGSGQGIGAPGTQPDESTSYWSLAKCKRAYLDYLGSKQDEITEQKDARRYRHASHWTAAQIAAFNKRKQPVVTYNRIGRKIDGVVGLVEKLRQDPKAYPRTPEHEQGAELATAVLRYVLDEQDWKAKSPVCAEQGAVDGIGGIEIILTEGDKGDREIGFEVVDGDGFFYDPRSFRMDFSDARFLGTGKWVDLDTAKALLPGHDEDLEDSVGGGMELTTNSDRDDKWFGSDRDRKRLRLIDLWYKHEQGWCWCIFTGARKIMEGRSYLSDEKGKEIAKYVMFSAYVDQDGDRYGFVRNLKSAQDEINQRRSKGLHELNSRRIIGEIGAFDDVEKARTEAARPDGFVLRNKGFEAEFDDAARQANVEGQLKFLEDAKNEIENFGPNPALIGQGIENRSGRAIALLQQAGIAELGPYILSYRGWKVRVYRAIFNAIQKHWTNERWIRVTDDEGIARFVQVNTMANHPVTGMPTIVNAIGSLDVDIILDEGPDQVNMMADVYETLSNVLPSIAPLITPQEARAAVQLLIATSPLPNNAKKQFKDASQQAMQPDPMQDQAKQIALAGEAEKVKETTSKTALNYARAQEAAQPQPAPAPKQMQFELPPQVQVAQAAADIEDTQASAMHKRAQAGKIEQDTALAPFEMLHDVHRTGAELDIKAKQAARPPAQGS